MSKTIAQKMFDIQQRLKPLTKDSDNPFFKSKYADLNQCLHVVKEECGKEGLLLVQAPDLKDGCKGVRTDVIDVATGTTIGCFVPFTGNEKNAQEVGAAITYNRRFGIVSLFAMEQEDDDGNEASGRGRTTGSVAAPIPARPTEKATSKPAPIITTKAPAKPEAPKTTREIINKKITLTSKVIIDSKRATQDEVVAMLSNFGVKTKEELNNDQAAKLLSQLEERLNK